MTIQTANAHLDEAYVSQLVDPVGQYVMIAVSDTGVGMDSATAARVRYFFTTRASARHRPRSQPGLWVCAAIGRPRLDIRGRQRRREIYLPRYLAEADHHSKIGKGCCGRWSHRGGEHPLVEDDDVLRRYKIETLTDLNLVLPPVSGGLKSSGWTMHRPAIHRYCHARRVNGCQRAVEARRRPGLKMLFATACAQCRGARRRARRRNQSAQQAFTRALAAKRAVLEGRDTDEI
jgi:hypothetical protein